ncbi:LRR receptor-like serine/threonine-protein kinase GSO1 [Heracleum sosnowskyi]|uniref:LRR receptor-like serine/threonine-protein kinase GSO1 n=1 Tax=Heracleum sosnowskyi TaxID=360622 RepID=A0AAD8H985_9APIA|nr:LRR receptor-like serine/threonine-protein kinase GSO1 [Heracleum sosnowskyi]
MLRWESEESNSQVVRRNVDTIAVLQLEQVVETGNHEELIAKAGAYASLIRFQQMVGDGDIANTSTRITNSLSLRRHSLSTKSMSVLSGSFRSLSYQYSTGSECHIEVVSNAGADWKKSAPRNYFFRLLKLNAPEWPYIILGIVGSILSGIILPTFAIIMSNLIKYLLQFKSSLLNLYNTSNSSVAGLESWNSSSDCCTWNRVVCGSHSGDITALHLDLLHTPDFEVEMISRILEPIYGIKSLMLLNISNNLIEGEISGIGLANLTKLVHLDMSFNNFNGSIPPQLFLLKFLQFLDISYNNIQGEIMGNVSADFTKLVHLDMSWNGFNCSIPAQLYHMKFLEFLDLSHNSLVGGLSSEIGKLGNLVTLKLDENYLYGNIPVQIGNLTKLRQFSICQNKVSGPVPDSILRLKRLESLDMRSNYLQMQIPNEIGTLSNISTLVLSKNSFTGVIPLSIRNLSKLETLRLQDNMLSGEIPSWLFDIETLKNLYLGGNKLIWNNNVKIVPKCILSQLSLKSCQISADIPEWISTQKNLDVLELSDNHLVGKFPPWLAEMDIGSILLSRNELTGSIPSRLFQSPSLSILALSRNKFSGELPENIGDGKKIKLLLLSGNNFSGAIPKSIGDIPLLMLLDLSRNRFSGNTFPVFDPDCSLFYVDLSSNEFTGDIPVSFCTETGILALGENQFSGNLPRNLTNLENLEYLDLHDNNISGDFPEFISQMSSLQVLSLRNNSLHGSLSSNSFSNQSSLRIVDLSSNNLVGSIPSELKNLKGMTGSGASYLISRGIDNIEVNWIEAKISLFRRRVTFTIEMNDLTVNWKNALRGLSSHSRHIYSLLDLSNNKLSGDIPASLGILKGLKLLNISNNELSGYIPQSFGDLESIETLDLSNNNITGTIPQVFRKLNQLSVLDVSNNKLSGKIPQGGQMDTMDDLSYYANNSGLCGIQIRVKCLEDELTTDAHEKEGDDVDEQDTWFLWEGVWIGFPLGFISSRNLRPTPVDAQEVEDDEEPWFLWTGFTLGFSSSVLTAYLSGYFVKPTQKYYRHR